MALSQVLADRLHAIRMSILQTLDSEHAEVLTLVASQACEQNAACVKECSCNDACNDTAPALVALEQKVATVANDLSLSPRPCDEATPAGMVIQEQNEVADESLSSSRPCTNTAPALTVLLQKDTADEVLPSSRQSVSPGAAADISSCSRSSPREKIGTPEQEGTCIAEDLQENDEAAVFSTGPAPDHTSEVVEAEKLLAAAEAVNTLSVQQPMSAVSTFQTDVSVSVAMPHSLDYDLSYPSHAMLDSDMDKTPRESITKRHSVSSEMGPYSTYDTANTKRKSAQSFKSLQSNKSCCSQRAFTVADIWLDSAVPGELDEPPASLERGCTKQALLYLTQKRRSTVRSAGLGGAPGQIPAQLKQNEMPRCIIQPTAPARVAWDLTGMFLILFDVIFLPLQLFEPPETMLDIVMGWTTRIFWMSDIPATLCTGYFRQDALVEVRQMRILRHYASTWMLPDLVVNGFDWASVFIAADAGQGAKTLRVLRMLRMIRLLRVARMPRLFQVFAEHFGAAEFELTCDIVKIIAVFLSTTHWIACSWYFIGSQRIGNASWVEQRGYENSALGLRYVTALHWSVTQFIGSMEIFPQNWLERGFACVVLVGAFVMSASFVSSITSAMTRHNITRERQFKQFSKLRMYMNQQGISQRLAVRIVRHAQFCVREQQRNIPEQEVELLQLVTEPLMTSLHFELYAPTLLDHAFFNLYNKIVNGVLQKVCHQAVSVRTLSVGDVVFSAGDILNPPEMFFVVRGNLRYTQKDRRASVNPGHFVCESVLWTSHWLTKGKLRALNNCRLVVLNGERFQKIATSPQFHNDQFNVLDYAVAFVKELNEDLSLLSDVRDHDQTEEVLSKCVVKNFDNESHFTSIVSSDGPLAYAESNSVEGYDHRNRKSSWLSNASAFSADQEKRMKRASTAKSAHHVLGAMTRVASIASRSVRSLGDRQTSRD